MQTPRHPDTRTAVYLGLGSILANLLVLAFVGIVRAGDSFRYLDGAAALLSGHPLQPPGVSQYIGYVVVVAASSALGAGVAGVVAAQCAAAALAAIALYDLGRQFAGRLAGLVASIAFIVDVDIAQWHAYVLTDSLYISFVVIATWCVHRAATHGGPAYVLAMLACLVIATIRPNGWIFGPLAGLYWLSRSSLSRPARIGIAATALVVLAGVISVSLYQRYHAVVANPPRGWDNTRAFADVWLGLFGSAPARENRLALAATRVASELGHVRPTYSARHNAAVVILLLVVYPLTIAGIVRHRRDALTHMLLVVIGGHLLIVALTFADRDGRYLLYVFPLMLVFAASSVAAIVSSRLRSRTQPAHSPR
jgi:hypothetical protein